MTRARGMGKIKSQCDLKGSRLGVGVGRERERERERVKVEELQEN